MIFVQHGLLCSSADWVISYPTKVSSDWWSLVRSQVTAILKPDWSRAWATSWQMLATTCGWETSEATPTAGTTLHSSALTGSNCNSMQEPHLPGPRQDKQRVLGLHLGRDGALRPAHHAGVRAADPRAGGDVLRGPQHGHHHLHGNAQIQT